MGEQKQIAEFHASILQALPAMTTAQRQRWIRDPNGLQKFLSGLVSLSVSKYLKLISDSQEIVIVPTNGKRTIAGARNVFVGLIDPDFVNYGLNVLSESTKKSQVQVFDLIVNGTFSQIFDGFGENIDRLCLTQDQIISFVENHSKWLCSDGTFFLLKGNNKFFVVDVRIYTSGYEVHVNFLSNASIWGHKRRIVVPKL